NFFDGIAIAAAFVAGMPTGIATTLAVLLHEIPQEIGDYSLLVYSGFGKLKALLWNLASAVLAIIGALLFYFYGPPTENATSLALGFAAGMFVYMAASDLFPELHKEKDPWKSSFQLLFMLMGIATIWAIVEFLHV
ncbi:MAG: ZIP family metal transporter, partial [Candidatus Micrarchaeota archaeon]